MHQEGIPNTDVGGEAWGRQTGGRFKWIGPVLRMNALIRKRGIEWRLPVWIYSEFKNRK